MLTLNQPIKRTKALQPLSREHHDTLLFVWKIRQGIANTIDLKRIRAYCSWYWDNCLKIHMQSEETALTKVLSPSHALMYNMIDDHAAIKTKLEQVIDDPSYVDFKRLSDIIYYHVRFEERSLFPLIEQTATSSQLNQIQAELSEAHSTVIWTDEFWTKDRAKNAVSA
jgi:hemerythrin-like domain-containing protein